MNNELRDQVIEIVTDVYDRQAQINDSVDEIIELVEAALTQQQEAEPVAWALRWPSDVARKLIGCSTVFDTQEEAEDYLGRCAYNDTISVAPLYLHPPKPAAQPQVPMQVTDGGRNELYEGLFDDETALEREERLRKARVPQQVPEGWDSEAYMSVCDGLEYWKKRAEEAEQALERIWEDLSPTYMGEPVLPQWAGWACQYPGKMPRLYGAREIAEANCYRENGDTLIYLQSSAAQHVEYKGWYCAHCQRGVDSSEVTYNEQHQSCGRVITDDKPPAAQPQVPDDIAADAARYRFVANFMELDDAGDSEFVLGLFVDYEGLAEAVTIQSSRMYAKAEWGDSPWKGVTVDSAIDAAISAAAKEEGK